MTHYLDLLLKMFDNGEESSDVELNATIIIVLRRIAAKGEHVKVFRLVDISTIEKKNMHKKSVNYI